MDGRASPAMTISKTQSSFARFVRAFSFLETSYANSHRARAGER